MPKRKPNTASKARQTYENDILPLVNQIKLVCRRLDMPFFFTICVDPNNEAGPEYESEFVTDFVSSNYVGAKMKPDNIAECIKIVNGFHAVANTENSVDIESLYANIEEEE